MGLTLSLKPIFLLATSTKNQFKVSKLHSPLFKVYVLRTS